MDTGEFHGFHAVPRGFSGLATISDRRVLTAKQHYRCNRGPVDRAPLWSMV